MEFRHYPVLLKETVRQLCVRPDGIYVDGTLGGGGHAFEICRRLSEQGHLYGIDQDAAAIQAASGRLSQFGDRATVIRSNYCRMKEELKEQGVEKADGIGFIHKYDVPVVKSPCPADGHTKREYVKKLLRELNLENPGVKERMFTAIVNSSMKGWEKSNVSDKS